YFLCFFSITRRRPPTPTLFPYTTLFRSVSTSAPSGNLLATTGSTCRTTPMPRQQWSRKSSLVVLKTTAQFERYVSGSFDNEEKTDRKSTRLNSSHLGISYAVFCLKKKIK